LRCRPKQLSFVGPEGSFVICCKEVGRDGLHKEGETVYPRALEVKIHQCHNQQFCSCHGLLVKPLHCLRSCNCYSGLSQFLGHWTLWSCYCQPTKLRLLKPLLPVLESSFVWQMSPSCWDFFICEEYLLIFCILVANEVPRLGGAHTSCIFSSRHQ
jgi:hypothetical protein